MPSTVVMPTTSGSSAARPRKNRIESSNRSGKASSSARPRSSPTVSPICRPDTAGPPTVTFASPSKASSAASATSSSSTFARTEPVTSALPPSWETPAGAASTTPGMPASRSAAACVRCSSPAPSTSRTMSGEVAWPVARSSCRSARADSDESVVKPPLDSREPATGPPTTPARTTKASRMSRVRRGRAAERFPRRSSMASIVGRGSRSHICPGESLAPLAHPPPGVRAVAGTTLVRR